MRKVVGFSQKIRRAWLDDALDHLAKTGDEGQLRSFLDRQLRDDLPGKESRAKASGIILRMWTAVPAVYQPLRERALGLLPRISGEERIWLHWGMAALAYPFFRDLAEVVGRLLALQDDFTTMQVQKRIMTSWGDRSTSTEAAQKLVTSFVDWGVLRGAKEKGHFLLTRKVKSSLPDLQLWLLEALLGANAADEIEAQQLLRLPEAFPFTFNVGVADLRKCESFSIHRQGLDMDVIALHKSTTERPPHSAKRSSKWRRKAAKASQPSLFDNKTESLASGNGLTVSATLQAANSGLNNQRDIEDSIKEQVLRTLPRRAARFLQVRGDAPVPESPFAAPSAECAEQFRDGHFFGCIVLTRTVLEAVIRHSWQMRLKKRPKQAGSFECSLKELHKRRLLSDECQSKLETMWTDRDLFLRLCLSAEGDQKQLEDIARDNLKLLNEVEKELFLVLQSMKSTV